MESPVTTAAQAVQAATATKLKALTLTKRSQYRKNGVTKRIYRISGDKASIAAYIESNPGVVFDNENPNIPLFFTRRMLGNTAQLVPNEDGTRWYAEANDMIELQKEVIYDMFMSESGGSNPFAGVGNQEFDEDEDVETPQNMTTQMPKF